MSEKKSFKNALNDCLNEAVAKDDSIVLVSADSGPNSGFKEFITDHPEKYFECGIAETAAESVCSGLATTGFTPIFCAPSPFSVGRAYEFFRIDLGYMRQNVKIIGRNCGFSYNDLGPTHYGLDDIALVNEIPEVMILAPQDAYEMEECFKAMLAHKGPVYMRVHNNALVVPEEKREFDINKAVIYEEGEDIAIISTGNETEYVWKALDEIKAAGVKPTVIGIHTLSPIDKDAILLAAKTGKIVTVEEHFANGGLGSIVANVLAEECPTRMKKIAVPNIYCTSGPYDELSHLYGLDPEGIAKTVIEFAKE